ncbi:MAG: HAMP domain-containing protein [Sediminibacterium sp.]|jgi:signal transduction histidine kinase|nr:HAMP domain-containing protein [Sediminibacterium sp.]MBX9779150.1 HAMP domain-containing protein [Chitinophagaceae bacterium]
MRSINIKLRFALLFTSFVAIILAISFAFIYVLYSSYREEDYFNRIFIEGSEVYTIFSEIKGDMETLPAKFIQEVHDKTLVNEKLFIVDTSGKVVFKMPDSLKINVQPIDRSKFTKNNSVYRYTDAEDAQHVIIYFPQYANYVHTSGFDKVGFRKLKTLRVILGGVFIGSLFLTAIISFLFVNEALKPLVRLSLQMKRTTEQNLSDRIDVPSSKDEISQIAKNFNAMLERLRKAFFFQKNFVQHASHELRTPLAVMLSQTESALHNPHTIEEYKKILESLREDQQQMIELTNSLLLISQYEKIDFQDDWPQIRVDELLYEVAEIAQKNMPDMQISIEFESIPEQDSWLTIKGSDSLMRSVFMNLIKNAYKYSTDQIARISIAPSKQQLIMHFDNTGTRLTPLEVEKLMIPFFRGANAHGKKGFGLGLSIIQRIVTMHGGKVDYRTPANKMNRFTITLPTIAN